MNEPFARVLFDPPSARATSPRLHDLSSSGGKEAADRVLCPARRLGDLRERGALASAPLGAAALFSAAACFRSSWPSSRSPRGRSHANCIWLIEVFSRRDEVDSCVRSLDWSGVMGWLMRVCGAAGPAHGQCDAARPDRGGNHRAGSLGRGAESCVDFADFAPSTVPPAPRRCMWSPPSPAMRGWCWARRRCLRAATRSPPRAPRWSCST